jgi:hypothetical protein
MKKVYLSNAFSISMLGALPPAGLTVKVRPLTLEEVKGLLKRDSFTSAVGHESTAKVISLLTGVDIPVNRVAITMREGDSLVVFQLGIRLQEGQILSEEEVLSLYREGKASFALVEVQE